MLNYLFLLGAQCRFNKAKRQQRNFPYYMEDSPVARFVT